ncbi:MAG: hypothetical protein JW798_09510, partial [Prolixibacteraceae bacterium]|nr:hypothetical protein [Prolixibacteraceae bacterium]
MIKLLLLSMMIVAISLSGLCQNTERNELNDWENPQVFGINKEYYHVNVVPYPDLKSSLKMDYTQSAFYKSLNGTWKINHVSKPADAPADFFKPEYSIAGWKDVKVPYSLENAGFG